MARPIMVPRAPRAQALSTSWPLRMPPSIQTSIFEPTSATMAGSASMLLGAPSSWRPPWLLTTIASAPLATARRASSTSMMPLRMSLPPHCSFTQAMSGHERRGSNCSLVQAASELMSLTPFTCPTRLRKVWRRVPAMPRHQRGLVIRLMMLRSVGLGGAVRPFFRSLWRWPITCRSSVSTRALHLASLARWIMRAMASRSRIM